jgi:hypothetical protein
MRGRTSASTTSGPDARKTRSTLAGAKRMSRIYSVDVLEHVDAAAFPKAAQAWVRILKSGNQDVHAKTQSGQPAQDSGAEKGAG